MLDAAKEDVRAVQQDKSLRDGSDSGSNGSSVASMHDQTESTTAGWWP